MEFKWGDKVEIIDKESPLPCQVIAKLCRRLLVCGVRPKEGGAIYLKNMEGTG